MRVARPHELKSEAVPLLTARVSEAELSKLFPLKFEEILDPEATPEPSKAALVKLTAGPYSVLYWGQDTHQLTLRIPTTTDASAFLEAFFREVPLPRSHVLWHRPDVRLPRVSTGAKVVREVARSYGADRPDPGVPLRASRRSAVTSRRLSARKK
jgi:hypothetical protein